MNVKQIRGKFADEKYLGPEPVLKPNYTQSELIKAHSWYNYFYDSEKSKEYTIYYAKSLGYSKADLAHLAKVDKSNFGSIGWNCRLISTGSVLNEESVKNIKLILDAFLSIEFEEETIDEPRRPLNVQDYVREKASEIIGDFEVEIDRFLVDFESSFNPYEYMLREQVKSPIAKRVNEFYVRLSNEIALVLTRQDVDLNEAYKNLTRSELKKYLAFVDRIVSDSAQLVANVKKTRKPRKKKQKSASQLAARVKHKASDDKYKVVSVAPSEIVGCNQLWTFNTKTRLLSVYNASGPSGLNVKGTTITGFDAESSVGKNLRKPEEILPKVTQGGKIVLRKLISEINSKPKVLNGRINSDTILLRAIK